MLKAVYLDLDGTLLGPGGSLLAGAGGPSADGAQALIRCQRAGVEVVIVTGRPRSQAAENARMLGLGSYVFELGAGVVIDGGTPEWLTGGLVPSGEAGSVHHQIGETGAPRLLLEHFHGRLEYHEPWCHGRDVSHLLRGAVDVDEADALLSEVGLDWLRVLDNGVIDPAAIVRTQLGPDALNRGLHIYHLVPRTASKLAGVTCHMRRRGYPREATISIGDSREDMQMADATGCFWLVANAVGHDPQLARAAEEHTRIRLCQEGFGAGVAEAIQLAMA